MTVRRSEIDCAMRSPAASVAGDKRVTHIETWCALQELTSLYWRRVDRIDAGAVDELYTEGGVMNIGSLRCEGREQIRAFFVDRNAKEQAAKRTTRHLVGTFGIEPISGCRFRIRSTVQVLSGNGDWPLPSAPPSSVGDFEDIAVKTVRGFWLFESRVARIVFSGAGAAAFAR